MAKKMKKWRMPKLRLGLQIVLYLLTVVFAGLAMVSILYGERVSLMGEIIIYSLSAISFSLSCYYILGTIIRTRGRIKENLSAVISSNYFTERLAADQKYRITMVAAEGVFINMAFGIFNGIAGWVNSSAWFGTLSAYYLLLGVMRIYWFSQNFSIIIPDKKTRVPEVSTKRLQRYYGILFIFMAIILAGAVILLINRERGKEYPGYMIYVAALYAFTKIILAIINVVRARKRKQQLWIIIRDIGLVDAFVSILTLQTAMFSEFSEGPQEMNVIMNGITGAVVSLFILAMGIRYLITAKNESTGN